MFRIWAYLRSGVGVMNEGLESPQRTLLQLCGNKTLLSVIVIIEIGAEGDSMTFTFSFFGYSLRPPRLVALTRNQVNSGPPRVHAVGLRLCPLLGTGSIDSALWPRSLPEIEFLIHLVPDNCRQTRLTALRALIKCLKDVRCFVVCIQTWGRSRRGGCN